MNLSGLNKVYCPYCGCEMLLTLDWSSLNYAYKCINLSCGAASPLANTQEEALVKATTMYKPSSGLMTMQEVQDRILRIFGANTGEETVQEESKNELRPGNSDFTKRAGLRKPGWMRPRMLRKMRSGDGKG